jgi:hypothetical protein
VVFILLVLAVRAWLWTKSLFGFSKTGRKKVRVIARQ